MRYFRKVLLSRPLRFANVAPPAWQPIGDDEGIVAVDGNEKLLNELQNAARRKVGGIIEVTEAEFIELKKKVIAQPLPSKPREAPRIARVPNLLARPAGVASVREPIQELPPNPLPPADGPPTVAGPTVRRRTFIPLPSDQLKGVSTLPTNIT